MRKADPQWTVDTFHLLRIALKGDALAPWQMIAIGAATLIAALVYESRRHMKTQRPCPGFRGGVLMGMFVSILASSVLGWISYRVLSSGAMRCLMKRCRGSHFSSIEGRTYDVGDGYVSMTFDPAFFWTSYALMSCITVVALAFLFSCIRASMHWRELD